MATTVKCAACGFEWTPDSGDVNDPGQCRSCDQYGSTPVRCESCPVNEVAYHKQNTATGRRLARVLEHDFDCKHYSVNPGDVSVEIREGFKILETERMRWEKETREEQQRKWEEKRRVEEMQRRGGRF